MSGSPTPDPYATLRAATRARVGLGRAGDALPTRRVLEFAAAHAAARDAVHLPLDTDLLRTQLGDRSSIEVTSQAADRTTYLQRPDLGRRLDPDAANQLSQKPQPRDQPPRDGFDVCFVLADGLSARAVHDHGVALLSATLVELEDWTVAPIVLATQARVALGDEIGERLGATSIVLLIGERPGLSAADSLGAYLTYRPRPGRSDAERNCLSNIRPPHGQPYDLAAAKLALLLGEARRRRISGVGLKDDFGELAAPGAPSSG